MVENEILGPKQLGQIYHEYHYGSSFERLSDELESLS